MAAVRDLCKHCYNEAAAMGEDYGNYFFLIWGRQSQPLFSSVLDSDLASREVLLHLEQIGLIYSLENGDVLALKVRECNHRTWRFDAFQSGSKDGVAA